MGWFTDKNAEADARLAAAVAPSVPAGEALRGVALANRRSAFSAKLYAIAVTESHLLLQQLDRSMSPAGPALVLRAEEIDVGNIFLEGAGIGGLGTKGDEIRFTAGGEQYKLTALGGTMVENVLASDAQVAGLSAVAAFLRAAKR